MPNQTWQSDFTHYPLARHHRVRQGHRDPHLARRLLPLRPLSHRAPSVTTTIVLATFRKAAGQTRHPRLHPDRQRHGLHRPPRRPRRQGGRNGFEQQLHDWHVVQKNSRPNHPTTCGKVERFQQTMKNWLRAQIQPTTIAELQALLEVFVETYNQQRPHRSLPHRATPATLYETLPKALPGPSPRRRHPRPGPARPHRQVRHRLPARPRPTPPHRHRPNPQRNPRHPAHPGPRRPRRQRRHRRTPPRTDHRPRNATTNPETAKIRTPSEGSDLSDLLRDHMVAGAGFEPATSGL